MKLFFTNISRIFKFAIQNFWRNFWLSFITIFIITLSFLSINFSILTNALLSASVQAVEKKIDLTIYFKQNSTEDEILNLQNKIKQLSEVDTVYYVSKFEALEKFKLKHKDDKTITNSLAELDQNPLVASLIIKAKNIESYPAIISFLDKNKSDNVVQAKDFQSYENLLAKLANFKDKIKNIGIGLTIFFIFITILIVYNTIKISIYTHREEIGIMKLVGATNWFIRMPMILESSFYSFFAIVLTIIITYPILGFIQPYVTNFFDGISFDVLSFFNDNFITIFGLQLVGSIILNAFSSSLAISKYLKV